jgi:hypothetical protein
MNVLGDKNKLGSSYKKLCGEVKITLYQGIIEALIAHHSKHLGRVCCVTINTPRSHKKGALQSQIR